MTDKKILRVYSISVLAALLISFTVPLGVSGRIIAAFLLLPSAVTVFLLIKKRPILSYNKNQVIYLIALITVVYLALYYLSGLRFGFYSSLYKLNLNNLVKFILPISVIIVSTEIIRYVVVSQNDRLSTVFGYFACIIAEIMIYTNLSSVTAFYQFLELIAGNLLPAILSNLLYNYLSKRYGVYPNLVFRLATTLNVYIIPVVSGISDSLLNFIRILLPIAIYLFIDALYEKKRKHAIKNRRVIIKVASAVLTVAILFAMLGTVMLVSNQFRYGAFVVATGSMTGELNKGDVAIYERYEGQVITEGRVIAFEKNDKVTIHRVVDIEIINGEVRYYTKGDANNGLDTGFVSQSEIVGLIEKRLPYAGYPSIWIRSLFKR